MKNSNRFLLAIILCLGIIFYVAAMLPQDIVFSEYKKSLSKIQHPAETEFIKTYYFFGALDKTRIMYRADFPQGCDYRVGEVREYAGTQESIKTFYARKTILLARQKTTIGILFLPTNSAGFIDPERLSQAEIVEWGPGIFSILENLRYDQSSGVLHLKPLAAYYFLNIGGFSRSNWDFRCQL